MSIDTALQTIRERLLASGLPLRRVAEVAGMAENTVGKVAKADPRVTVATLRRIERVLDRHEAATSSRQARAAA